MSEWPPAVTSPHQLEALLYSLHPQRVSWTFHLFCVAALNLFCSECFRPLGLAFSHLFINVFFCCGCVVFMILNWSVGQWMSSNITIKPVEVNWEQKETSYCRFYCDCVKRGHWDRSLNLFEHFVSKASILRIPLWFCLLYRHTILGLFKTVLWLQPSSTCITPQFGINMKYRWWARSEEQSGWTVCLLIF